MGSGPQLLLQRQMLHLTLYETIKVSPKIFHRKVTFDHPLVTHLIHTGLEGAPKAILKREQGGGLAFL